jgi:uncharacterized protein (DUF2141 family)
MHNIFFFILFILFNQDVSTKGTLTINVIEINESIGKIQIGVFNNAADFPKKNKEFKKIIIDAHAPSTTYALNNIPHGTYAIAVFHDKNNDGRCNRNLLGIPIEGYGFSNNILPKLRPPPFAKTQFTIGSVTSVSISLVY